MKLRTIMVFMVVLQGASSAFLLSMDPNDYINGFLGRSRRRSSGRIISNQAPATPKEDVVVQPSVCGADNKTIIAENDEQRRMYQHIKHVTAVSGQNTQEQEAESILHETANYMLKPISAVVIFVKNNDVIDQTERHFKTCFVNYCSLPHYMRQLAGAKLEQRKVLKPYYYRGCAATPCGYELPLARPMSLYDVEQCLKNGEAVDVVYEA